MPISDILNGEVGLSVRNKLNAVIAAINALDPISRLFTYTATGATDDLQKITIDAAGYTSVSNQMIEYCTGTYQLGDQGAVFNIQVDGSLATGGSIAGNFVQAPDIGGLDSVAAYVSGAGIAFAVQLIDNAATETVGLVDGVDELADLLNPAVDTDVFIADNDTLVIGADAAFDDVRVILSTNGSTNAGLTFEYSTGVGTWAAFVPSDSTFGFINSGVVYWGADNLVGWVAGDGGGNFLIRLTRTTNNIPTTPVIEELAYNNTSFHSWDKDGILNIHQIIVDGMKTGTLLAPPAALAVGETWADTTDSADHPIVRQSVNGTAP